MSTKFPQELIDEILDYFAEDFRSLKFCSLVCREWVFRSRSHLFKKCALWPSRIPGFCELLRSPACTFLRHVRTIRHIKHYSLEDCDLFNAIAADLGRLINVRELEILTRIYHPASSDSSLYTAFPKITRLLLTFECGFHLQPQPFVNVIRLFPALQELHIYGSGHWEEILADTVPPPQLRSLALSKSSATPILAWLDATNHLTNVHSLRLPSLSLSDVSTVRAALQRLGSALHHLDISLSEHRFKSVDTFAVVNLSLHPNLRTLDIHDSSADYEALQMIPSITKLAAPSLERLSLDLDLGQALYTSLDWASLDAFLSPARFPRLRNVTFKCSIHRHHFYDDHFEGEDDEEPDVDDEHKFLHGALPLLYASGVLRIEW
ncbi:hypothetical protein B0H13DRAFT_2406685 [Mycena leptocephala]|nr:hypothetical protein B0H13DRAFT_2406685 [Mycena leptocephala]